MRSLAAQAQVFALGGYCVLPAFNPLRLATARPFEENGVQTVLDVVVPASRTTRRWMICGHCCRMWMSSRPISWRRPC